MKDEEIMFIDDETSGGFTPRSLNEIINPIGLVLGEIPPQKVFLPPYIVKTIA